MDDGQRSARREGASRAKVIRRIGDDVSHTVHGHGWVQGAGHGVMTVRFETRSSGPGPVHTLSVDTPDVRRANPVDSLDWPDYVDGLTAETYQSNPSSSEIKNP